LHSAGRIWDGQAWTESGLTGTIWKYYVFDEDGAGPALPRLYAAGTLSYNGASIGPVARLEGSAWVGVGSGVGGITDMTSWDEDGPGPLPKRLCILGGGGVHKLVNDTWVQVAPYPGSSASTLAAVDEDGNGPLLPTLFVGIDHAIRRLSAGAWTTIGTLNHTNCSCADVYGFDTFDPPGPEPERLLAAGYFSSINGIPCRGVSKWDGQVFSGLSPARGLAGAGLSLLAFDEDGPGPQSPALFVGGDFTQSGSVTSPGVARWRANAWSAVGGGVTGGLFYTHVGAMGAWDHDGSGPSSASLIVGGRFAMAGAVAANSIARWDGTAWHALGLGFVGQDSASISGIAAFDEDGPGPLPAALFVVGTFSTAGGVPANSIARWNGTAWSAVGSLPPEAGYCTSLGRVRRGYAGA
jgi:hypothetical protein